MSDAGFVIPITPRLNEAAARAATSQLGRDIRLLGQNSTKGFEAAQRKLKDLVPTAQLLRDFRVVERAGLDTANRIQKSFVGGFTAASSAADELEKDVKALQRTIEGQKAGARIIDPREFALLNRSLEKLQDFQRRVREVGKGDTQAIRKLRLEFEGLGAEATKEKARLVSSIKDQVAAFQVAERAKSAAVLQGNRERNIVLEREASKERVIAQREQQVILSNVQRTNQLRVQSTRFALETLGRLERAFGATVSGVARTATRAIGRAYDDTLGRVSQAFQRNSSRIEHISRQEGTSRLNIFRSTQARQERLLQESVTRQSIILQRAQKQAQSGVIGATRRTSLLGIGGGLGVAGVLTLGLERFSNLERLTKQFTALTGSAETAATVLAQVKEFARATPFDLVGVADLAKGFLAIKTPVDQVLPRVRAIADAVALTGGGVDELNRIQRAIGQVVSAGRLQGDELNQLAENLPGLNIRQILADQLTGGNVQDLIKMQEAGKITGDLFVDGLITGLANDPRLKGASEDLAKTLSGRLANLKEVVADVGAAFIGLIASPMKEATKQATVALDALSSFIKGEVSPAFLLLRTAVGGAVVAIGALFIAKTAGESLKVLATAARLVLTPMGAIVTVVGILGAAFAVMRTRSEEFRTVTDRLGRLLGTTFGRVLSSIGDAITTVRDAFATAPRVIDRTADAFDRALKPTQSWISEIGSKLGTAIAATGRFLTDTLIPALAQVAIFVGQRIGPAFQLAGQAIRTFVLFVSPVVEAFGRRVTLIFSSVADKAGEVVDSISEIASGARSALQPLLTIGGSALAGGLVAGPIGAIVAGIAAAFATLSPTLKRSLISGAEAARDTVVGFFRGIDWTGLAEGALKFVNRVGRILGQIVSDRRFLLALAGIAAAAGAIALQFVLGFVSGVVSNLGDIVNVGTFIGKAIVEGFNSFISNPKNLAIAALLTTGFLAGRQIFRVGQSVATEFQGGFRQGISAVRSGGDFLGSALFGPQGSNAFIREAGKTAKATADEVRRQLSTFSRASGGGGVLSVGAINNADIERANRQIQNLTTSLGTGATAGLRFRTAVQDTFTNIRASGGSISKIFSSIGTGFGDAAAAVKGQGAAIGSALGVGITGAFASAIGGQQLGRGNTVAGLGGILSAALLSGLAVGGGPQGIAIGGAVAGLGLLTAALTASKRKAEEFRSAVDASSDALTRLGDVSGTEAVRTLASTIGESLADEATATKEALTDAGLTVRSLADELVRLGADGGAGFKTVGETAGAFAFQVANGNRDLNGLITDFAGILRTVRAESPLAADALEGLIRQVQSGAISGGTFEDAVKALFRTIDQQDSAIADAATNIRLFGDAAAVSSNQAADLFEARVAGLGLNSALDGGKSRADDLASSLLTAKERLTALLNPDAGSFGIAISNLTAGLSGIGGDVAGAQAVGGLLGGAQINVALSNFRGQIAETVSKGIEDGASEADIENNLKLVQLAVSELDIPQPAKDALIAELQAAINADTIPVSVQADVASATKAGDDIRNAAAARLRGGNGEAEAAGRNISAAFARGIRSSAEAARREAAALAANVVNSVKKIFAISSPSAVFMGIGLNITSAMAGGIEAGASDVSIAMEDVASQVTATADEIANQIRQKQGDLFDNLFAGNAVVDAAKVAINSGLGSILSAAQSADRDALERVAAGGALGNTRSIALDFEGLSNRQAIAAAVENIKSLGSAMLAAGKPVDEITSALSQTRTDLLNFAATFGFSREQVEALINELGLTTDAISRFGSEAKKVTADVTDPAKDATATPDQPTIEQTVNVHLQLPYANPDAVALAVGNRVATAVRL